MSDGDFNTDDLDQQVSNCFADLKAIERNIKSLEKLKHPG